MPFPQYSKKYDQEVIITPQQHFLAEKEDYKDFHPPKSIILCFESSLMDHAKSAKHTTHRAFWTGEMIYFDDLNHEVALVGNFGIGGPAASQMLEILIAAGVKQFIVIGHAGGLQKSNPIGSVILTDKAVRDEGVSHHYLKPEKYAYPSSKLSDQLQKQLEKSGINCRIGSSWTIDSMYRETKGEVQQYAAEGIATVEMELASLFAVATFRKVELASLLVISDLVAFEKWDEHLKATETKNALLAVFATAKKCLCH